MTIESPWEVAARAANALAPESGLLAHPDAAGFGDALAKALRGATGQPAQAGVATLRLVTDLAMVAPTSLAQWLGGGATPPLGLNPKDRRFSDAAWNDNPVFSAIRAYYATLTRFSEQLIDASGVDEMTEKKARLAASLLLDALAPTNFLLTNPAALKRAFESGGKSVVRGAGHFVDDLINNKGQPRKVDSSPFVFGTNMAATPGKVVYRNDLMELIQYQPQTPHVHAAPLLCSPPWINKFYVMDLAPGRSFIEWAVQHNRTVFAISYRSPTAEMSGVTMEDYLVKGPLQALDVISEITSADTIDIVGLCLGGALTAITDAYFAGIGDTRIGNLTLLNTMLDYSDPGALGMFTDLETVNRIEKRMAEQGHLEGSSMAGTFDVMRANDLIFNYVVSNWLLGQDPPVFDILAWNADSTRMPSSMHAFYLRNFYVENKLSRGELELAGQRILLSDIKKNTYVVSAENDHIVPWKTAYAATHLLSGPVRFVLSSGGHIAGIVNPPGPKNWYLIGDETPADPAAWRQGTTRHDGSWWEDWAEWSANLAGDLIDPPPMGSLVHPVMIDAPGEYLRT